MSALVADLERLARVVAFEVRVAVGTWLTVAILAQLGWMALIIIEEPSFVRGLGLATSRDSWDAGALLLYAMLVLARASAVGSVGLAWMLRATRRSVIVVGGLWFAWTLLVVVTESAVGLARLGVAAAFGYSPADWIGGPSHHLRMLASGAILASFAPGFAALTARPARAAALVGAVAVGWASLEYYGAAKIWGALLSYGVTDIGLMVVAAATAGATLGGLAASFVAVASVLSGAARNR